MGHESRVIQILQYLTLRAEFGIYIGATPDFPVKLIVCIFYQTSRRYKMMIYTQLVTDRLPPIFKSVSKADLLFSEAKGMEKGWKLH